MDICKYACFFHHDSFSIPWEFSKKVKKHPIFDLPQVHAWPMEAGDMRHTEQIYCMFNSFCIILLTNNLTKQTI